MKSNTTIHYLQHESRRIEFELTRRRRKTMAIHVHPDSRVTVVAPMRSKLPLVEEFVARRAAWIAKHQAAYERFWIERPAKKYVNGESHEYLGRSYRLKVEQLEQGRERVEIERGRITIQVRDKDDPGKVQRRLTKWYRQQAGNRFEHRLDIWMERFERLGVSRPEIRIRRMKSRWGSCSPAGRITLNLKLIELSPDYIDYVLVHELCHLLEHNHSSDFYDLQERVMPEWRERREELNKILVL